MTADGNSTEFDVPLDKPTSARAYGWVLGGKDNYEIDRNSILPVLQEFPGCVDIARQNRRFLYRAVRYLVQDAGITQFIDMGCGLPTDNNVHQVAQRFNTDTRVVYVDIDPIVLAHGRALLADNAATTVITADMREPDTILEHQDTRRLIDLSEPVAVLFLSVGHHLQDTDSVAPRQALRHIVDELAVPGSHLAFSQVVIDDTDRGAVMSGKLNDIGIPWQTRTPTEVDALLDGLRPVDPGIVNVKDWRPDASQPPLEPVPTALHRYVGVTDSNSEVYEYGGIVRKDS